MPRSLMLQIDGLPASIGPPRPGDNSDNKQTCEHFKDTRQKGLFRPLGLRRDAFGPN